MKLADLRGIIPGYQRVTLIEYEGIRAIPKMTECFAHPLVQILSNYEVIGIRVKENLNIYITKAGSEGSEKVVKKDAV